MNDVTNYPCRHDERLICHVGQRSCDLCINNPAHGVAGLREHLAAAQAALEETKRNRDLFAAELIGVLGLDAERLGEPRGNVILEAVRGEVLRRQQAEAALARAKEELPRFWMSWEPHSLPDVMRLFVEATEHLLDHHNCDCDGYESWNIAVSAAKQWLELYADKSPRAFLASPLAGQEAPTDDDTQTYPCDMCGVMRSKAEGGTVFTVCDACWEKHHKKNRALAGQEPQARKARERVPEPTPCLCPHCHKDIGTLTILYGRCPHCGEKMYTEADVQALDALKGGKG